MEQDRLQDGTVEAFRIVSREFDDIYGAFAKACDLSEGEYWSLLMIRYGASTQAEISDQLCLSPQTVNSAFKLLVKKKLLRLEALEHNLRTKQIILTEVGEQFMKDHIARLLAIEQRVWQTMEESERVTLTHLMGKYCNLLRAALEQPSITESSSSEDLSSQ